MNTTTNTMRDLRKHVAELMKETLDGREIDHYRKEIRLPHMLGFVEIGDDPDYRYYEDTILSDEHEFWDEWYGDIYSMKEATERVETAIRTLREDDYFRITYPYGTEADVAYTEVDVPKSGDSFDITCDECGAQTRANITLVNNDGIVFLRADVDCGTCGNSGMFQTNMRRV